MSLCHLLRGICAAHHSKCTELQLRAKILMLFPHLEHMTMAAGDDPELDCTCAISSNGGVVHLGDESCPDFVVLNLFIPDSSSLLLNLSRDTCKKFHKHKELKGKLMQYKMKYSYEKAAAMPEAEQLKAALLGSINAHVTQTTSVSSTAQQQPMHRTESW